MSAPQFPGRSKGGNGESKPAASMKSAEPMPDGVRPETWQRWPRKAEVHLIWNVRSRQIDAFIARKKLSCYVCPDMSVRIPTNEIEAHFGRQPGEAVTATTSKVPVAFTPEELLDDPISAMFREVVVMLRDARQQHTDLLRLLLDPMNAAVAAMRDGMSQLQVQCSGQLTRIGTLEARSDEVSREREALIDNRAMRDLATQMALQQEARRKQISDVFVAQFPQFVAKMTGGTLSDFVSQYDPQEIELLLSTGFLKSEQVTMIRDIMGRQAAAKLADAKRRAAAASSAPAAAPSEPAAEHSAPNGAAAPTGGI